MQRRKMNLYEITYERNVGGEDGIYIAHIDAKSVRTALRKFKSWYASDAKITEIVRIDTVSNEDEDVSGR